jgi:hypothetical protein
MVAPPLPPLSVMPAAPGAMVPSPPHPSTTRVNVEGVHNRAPTCPRPRSPAISSATSSPPSLVISATVHTWFKLDLRLAARPHPHPCGPAHDLRRRVFTTLARDLRRRPHLG